MGGHFEPFDFTIELDFPRKTLGADGVERSILVHEYIHYLQCLSSTIGRCLLFELSRIAITGGHWKFHNKNPPNDLQHIDLDDVLSKSNRADFTSFGGRTQYADTRIEIDALLNPKLSAGSTGSGVRFHQAPLAGFPTKNVLHLEFDYAGSRTCVPLVDRVFFENAARQVQRHYLFMAIQKTDFVDRLLGQPGEAQYICLHECVEPAVRGRFDAREMTIALSQFCLLSAEPGTVFTLALSDLATSKARTREEQFHELRRNPQIAALMNKPNMDEVIREYGRLQTSILSPASLGLFRFRELITHAYNQLNALPWLFASSIVTWDVFKQWLRTFGCPEIRCSDGSLSHLEGIPCQSPWVKYLQLGNSLLA